MEKSERVIHKLSTGYPLKNGSYPLKSVDNLTK